jgi:hypothetical protein
MKGGETQFSGLPARDRHPLEVAPALISDGETIAPGHCNAVPFQPSNRTTLS